MPSAQILEYVHDQMEAGYSKDEIRQALKHAGWSEKEINDVLPAPPQVEPPVKTSPPKNYAFFLVFIAGILLIVPSIGNLFLLPLFSADISQGGLSINFLGLFSGFLSGMIGGTVMVVLSALVILSSFFIKRESMERVGSILGIIFSLLLLIGFSGVLFLAGGALGLVGGILAVKKAFQ